MKLTVREIARLAGVSPATVSRALNGQQGMSEATRRRVCRILEDHPENRRGRRGFNDFFHICSSGPCPAAGIPASWAGRGSHIT